MEDASNGICLFHVAYYEVVCSLASETEMETTLVSPRFAAVLF